MKSPRHSKKNHGLEPSRVTLMSHVRKSCVVRAQLHGKCGVLSTFLGLTHDSAHDLAICTRSVQSSQKRRFHHYDSDCCPNNTWPSFHTDRIDRAAVSPTTLADLAPASHTSSTSVCRFLACKMHQFHQRLQVSCFCKSHQFHRDSTQLSRS